MDANDQHMRAAGAKITMGAACATEHHLEEARPNLRAFLLPNVFGKKCSKVRQRNAGRGQDGEIRMVTAKLMSVGAVVAPIKWPWS